MLQQTICSAFSDGPFSGNLAATIIVDDFPSEQLMQKIAMSNNLPETTFLKPMNGEFYIRWFTPTRETVMAGHASLAAAFTIMEDNPSDNINRVLFQWSGGAFSVWRDSDILWMEHQLKPEDLTEPTHDEVAHILQITELDSCPVFIGKDVVAVLPSQEHVRQYRPNLQRLLELPGRGFAITAAGDNYDYVSRFFCPRYGVPEDPVTGSSHGILAHYWAMHLGRKNLRAWQCSPSGGLVYCQVEENRSLVGGKAGIYSKAELFV